MVQKTKNRNMLSAVLFTALFFCIISAIALFQKTDSFIGTFYSHYIGDFSIGVCSRLMMGQVLSLFKDSFTQEWITSFIFVSIFVMFFLAAAFMGSVLAKSEKTTTKALFIVCFMLCIYPVSFNSYLNINFGFLELYMIMLFIITAFAGERRIFIYFTPVIIFTGIMLHDSFMFSFMCPILALTAYYATTVHKKTVFTSAGFIVSAFSAVGTGVYSVFFSRMTLKMTEQQMLGYLAEKGNCDVSDVSGYLETFLYYTDVIGETGKTHVDNIFEVFLHLVEITAGETNGIQITQTVAALPFLVLIFAMWCYCIKNTKEFTKKIPYILFMLTPIPQLIAATVISMDYARFFSALIISQAFYLFVCAKQKDPCVLKLLEKTSEKAELLILPLTLMFLSGIS
ncbi:MAG: hypothetical protein IKW03_07750 [Clostridia bacterium]|nr:hypothetical protein [Clostridia bacterium]